MFKNIFIRTVIASLIATSGVIASRLPADINSESKFQQIVEGKLILTPTPSDGISWRFNPVKYNGDVFFWDNKRARLQMTPWLTRALNEDASTLIICGNQYCFGDSMSDLAGMELQKLKYIDIHVIYEPFQTWLIGSEKGLIEAFASKTSPRTTSFDIRIFGLENHSKVLSQFTIHPSSSGAYKE